MHREDWILFILTFVTGLFAGAYTFVVFFKPEYAPDNMPADEIAAQEFSIVGSAYSDTLDGYPSFRVVRDGSYQYFETAVSEPRSGSLPFTLLADLKAVATEESLITAESSEGDKECRSENGGVDMEYQVTRDAILYEIDTCFSTLPYESDLFRTFGAIWNYLTDPDSTYQSAREPVTPAKAAEGFIREHLSPYEE